MDSLFSKASSFLGGGSEEDGGDKAKSASSAGYGDMLSKASSFLTTSHTAGDDAPPPPPQQLAAGDAQHTKHTNSPSGTGDMMASAQLLWSAAKGGGQNKADMGEVAGAAADLIGGASDYTKLEKTSYGEYAAKAESYLHDYEASHAASGKHQGNPTTHSPLAGPQTGEESEKPDPYTKRW